MFKYVFIPADGSPVQEIEKSKSGGLEKDKLRLDAESHFKNGKRVDPTTPEQLEQVNAMLIKQGIDPTTVDKNLYAQIPNLGGAVEIVSLLLPTQTNGYVGISMYCDSNGQPKKLPANERATSLVRCCGHATTVFGDAFIGRCHDDESKPWTRLDFTSADMSSDASWVIEAKKTNQGKNMNAYSTSGTMENFMKQHAKADSSAAVEVLPEKPEDVLKKQANSLFVGKKYAEAETLYTQAIAVAEKASLAVLYTNRSAARAHLEQTEGALADAQNAIDIDATWMKAYHRKAAALEKLGRHKDAYETWEAALSSCARDMALLKQHQLAVKAWVKVFRSKEVPLDSKEDLVARFQLLTDKRERLSTLAHMWNDSSISDRFEYFQLFLALISGAGKMSETTAAITKEHMFELPMHNYEDLQRPQVASWCDFFLALPNAEKLSVFKALWASLSNEEKNDVIQDIQLLMERSVRTLSEVLSSSSAGAAAGVVTAEGGSSSGSEMQGDEELSGLKPTAFSKLG